MANKLIVFPEAGDLWEEVEGPGMYVLSVLPRENETDPCAIGAGITLLRPEGQLLTPTTAPLWCAEETHSFMVQTLKEASQLFAERREPFKSATVGAQIPSSALSMEFVQVTRLGATGRTLRSTKTGEYWQADWKDLTPSGILLLHQIHTCFVRPPIMLTFLGDGDTE